MTMPDANKSPMPVLPNDVKEYRSTPVFTEENVPAALQKDHRTKSGVWGLIVVSSGELIYHITEPGFEGIYRLSPECDGVITPEHQHYVELCGSAEFRVCFYRSQPIKKC